MQQPFFINISDSDLTEVAALEARCFPCAWSEKEFKDALQSPFYHACGIKVAGQLAAYILYNELPDFLEILNIATAPEMRRNGYARLLLNNVFLHLDTEAVLEVRSKNIPARTLYASCGFLPVGLRKKYYQDDNDDAIVMRRPPRALP